MWVVSSYFWMGIGFYEIKSNLQNEFKLTPCQTIETAPNFQLQLRV